MLKFDRDVNSAVVWSGLWPSFLVVWASSCLVVLVPTCPDYTIWRGINAPTVLLLDLWSLAIISASRRYVGGLGDPKGSAAELLDGSLKLRYCTTVFAKRFLPWVLPRLG